MEYYLVMGTASSESSYKFALKNTHSNSQLGYPTFPSTSESFSSSSIPVLEMTVYSRFLFREYQGIRQ